MAKILLYTYKNCKTLPLYSVVNIPVYSNSPKYTKFKNFLEKKIIKSKQYPSCDNFEIGALEVNSKNVSINLEKCIGCLTCLSTNRNLESLETSIQEIIKFLFNEQFIINLNKNAIFKNQIIEFPTYKNRKTKSFSQFTAIKETEHISLWACSILNFLSSNPNPRIGKEIEILKAKSPRDGRLDVCVDNGDVVFIAETKTTLEKLLNENRYRTQIPSYFKACEQFVINYNELNNDKKSLMIFLIVGGNETDLLPHDHPQCSSRVGNKAKRFYNDILKSNIRFISAHSLLLMMCYSLFNNTRLCWDLLFRRIFGEDSIGLLTAGIIRYHNNEFIIENIPNEIIDDSVQGAVQQA